MNSTWKIIAKITALLATATYVVVALVLVNHQTDTVVCSKMDIYIDDPHNTGFISPNEVRAMLVNSQEFPEGRAVSELNLTRLERLLRSNPYIDHAKCHITAEGHLAIMLTPRHPVLHVLDNHGRDYYIDNHGDPMPKSYHTSDLMVLSGDVDSATAGPAYAPLAIRLQEDSFWVAQVQQIHIASDGDIELTPRVGQHIIELGDTTMLHDKLQRMQIFYTHALPRTGWDCYSRISLKYNGQIVCTKR